MSINLQTNHKNLPFFDGLAESSKLTGVSPYEVKGLGTDLLRTGGL